MIRIENLCKSFKQQKVLENLNISIYKGKVTVILGMSGIGKSVLLKHMMGLLKPDKGKIMVDGVDIVPLNEKKLNKIRMKFSMLFQDAALFDYMNVFDNVAFPLREHTKMTQKQITEKVKETLHSVGLRGVEEKMPDELSGGMRKRVGLARAIISDPEIILFDEPTTGLDPIISASIEQLIKKIHDERKITMVIITHEIKLMKNIADYVGMLHNGRIIEFCPPDMFMKSKNLYVKQFIEGNFKGPIMV